MSPDELKLKQKWVKLQCMGYTDNTIAEMTNSDRQWVKHFLQRNNNKALERMAKTRAAERAKQVNRLNYMIEQAAIAWTKSVTTEEVVEVTEEPANAQVVVNQAPGPTHAGYTQVSQTPMVVIKTKRTTRYKCGEVAYLKAMQGFMADVRAILKIDDGTRRVDFSLNLPGQDSIQATLNIKDVAAEELKQWNEEQRDRLARMLEMPSPPEITNFDNDDPEPQNGKP